MESKQIVTIINDIEQKFPVDTWKVNSFDIWPYLRFRLGSRLFERKVYTTRARRIVDRYVLGVFKYLGILLTQLSRKNDIQNVEYLFLENGIHVTKYGNLSYYIRTDSVREKLEKLGKRCHTFVAGYKFDAPSYFNNNQIQYLLDFAILKDKVLGIFSKRKDLSVSMEGYSDFLKYLKENGIDDGSLEERKMIRSVERIYGYKDFFKRKLVALKPKAVFILCYYSTYGFGMVKACKELGIPIVDIQHGIQGESHYAYGSFSKVPLDGYNTLPDIYYVWGDEEVRTLSLWKSRNIDIFRGGNDYLEMWRKGEGDIVMKSIEELKEKYGLEKYSKVILFTVYTGSGHDESIVEAISRSPKEYFWFVRLHPKSDGRSERMKERIGVVNCTWVIDGIVDIPLFALLKVSDVHVTERSSTIIEGAEIGIPSVVTTPECKVLFEEQFKAKMVSFREKPLDILKGIAESEAKDPNRGVVGEEIEKLLNLIDSKYARNN